MRILRRLSRDDEKDKECVGPKGKNDVNVENAAVKECWDDIDHEKLEIAKKLGELEDKFEQFSTFAGMLEKAFDNVSSMVENMTKVSEIVATHMVALKSVKERLTQVEEKQAADEEKIGDLMISADHMAIYSDDLDELFGDYGGIGKHRKSNGRRKNG